MQVDVYNKDGQHAGQIDLNEDVFAVAPNEQAMHQAVVVHLARKRQGTHKTKTRADVAGSGKKPWRQKGRGTARAGSVKSPLWSGGGTIHGPKPHTYDLKMPKKMARLARKSALSLRCSENNLVVVEDFNFDAIKTKNMAEVLKNLKINDSSVLIIMPENDNILYMSSRNIEKVSINACDKFSTYDVLKHKKILLFKGAVDKIVNSFNN